MVNTIINEDCLVAMRDIPDGSIDMICCDLPYGVLHRGNPHAQWDRMIPFEPLWEQYERIIKKNGAIILFGHGVFTAKCILSNERLFRYSLVWDKRRVTGFLNANRMPMRCHEDILVFYKRLPKYNPSILMASLTIHEETGSIRIPIRATVSMGISIKGAPMKMFHESHRPCRVG